MNNSWPRINHEIKALLNPGEKVEPAFEGTVLEGRERRYTVINEKDRKKYLTEEENQELQHALFHHLGKIEEGRAKDGKEPYNSYIVINTDEPYIDEIIRIMHRYGHWEGKEPPSEFKGPLTIHQNEDGSVQLRDSLSRFWCACGNPAVIYNEDNEPPVRFRCNKCLQKERI